MAVIRIENGYVSLAGFRAAWKYGSDQTGDDARIGALVQAASRAIDDYSSHRFYVHTGTRYFTAKDSEELWAPRSLDPILSIAATGLKTDEDGNRVYETTWAAADYDLDPPNAAEFGEPYMGIKTRSGNNSYSFPTHHMGVEIAGVWGYDDSTEGTGATVGTGDIDASATSLPVSDQLLLEVGDRLLIGTEQMLVTELTEATPDTATVERGINGTTAAGHDEGATISRYLAPPAVREACVLVTGRLAARGETPLGLAGAPDFGTQLVVGRFFDIDVKALLDPFKIRTVA